MSRMMRIVSVRICERLGAGPTRQPRKVLASRGHVRFTPRAASMRSSRTITAWGSSCRSAKRRSPRVRAFTAFDLPRLLTHQRLTLRFVVSRLLRQPHFRCECRNGQAFTLLHLQQAIQRNNIQIEVGRLRREHAALAFLYHQRDPIGLSNVPAVLNEQRQLFRPEPIGRHRKFNRQLASTSIPRRAYRRPLHGGNLGHSRPDERQSCI